ncbi:MAG: helix-turn-helix transcriptional regulator [Phycisphaerales bacterium]|nr:helix-turn-helix transcriptional regulator [Phycisphaerales bacterium]
MSDPREEVAARLRELRRRHFGARGKSQLAERLGIPLREYEALEKGQSADANLLIRACALTGEDLQWLLTGVAARGAVVVTGARERHRVLLARVAQLVDSRPQLAGAIEAFLSLLEESQSRFPQRALPSTGKQGGDAHESADAKPAARIPIFDPHQLPEALPLNTPLLPVPTASGGRGRSVTRVAPAASGRTPRSRPRAARGSPGLLSAASADSVHQARPARVYSLDGPAQSICSALIHEPAAEYECAGFLECPRIGELMPTAFGVRITTDDMRPLLLPGDVAVAAPGIAPELGAAALCRMADGEARCRIWLGRADGSVYMGCAADGRSESAEEASMCWAVSVLFRVTAAA